MYGSPSVIGENFKLHSERGGKIIWEIIKLVNFHRKCPKITTNDLFKVMFIWQSSYRRIHVILSSFIERERKRKLLELSLNFYSKCQEITPDLKVIYMAVNLLYKKF